MFFIRNLKLVSDKSWRKQDTIFMNSIWSIPPENLEINKSNISVWYNILSKFNIIPLMCFDADLFSYYFLFQCLFMSDDQFELP